MHDGLHIQRLRAHMAPGTQPVAVRLVLQSLGAELADALPTTLAPQALLMLRRVQLALPASALGAWPDAALRQQLRDAGRRHLRDAAAQARRPALDAVGDDAAAVLFADNAELLACLALDALRDGGARLARWWWRDLLQRAWPDWRSAFAQRPQAVPGALRLLARVDAGVVATLQRALHGAAPEAAPALPGPALSPRGGPHAGPNPALGRAARPRPRRGQAQLPPTSIDTPLAAATALPTMALLPDQAAPDQAPPFAAAPQNPQPTQLAPVLPQAASVQAGAKLHEGVDVARPLAAAAPAAGMQTSSTKPAEPTAPGPPAPAAKPARVGRTQASATAAQAAMPPQPAAMPASAPGLPPAGHQAPPATPPATPTARPAAAPATAPHPARPRSGARAPAVPAPPAAGTPEPAPVWPLPQVLTSPQAKLLLLVGALQDDGLYPDFTRPRDPGFALPIWQLLAELGARWLGAAALHQDPLWQALRARSGTLPRPKPAQLTDWWPLAASGGGGGGSPRRASLDTWLRGYSLALRQRLLARLDVDAAQFAAMLTSQPGERPALVWLSEADIVAVFDLNHHALAWRLAGLDRDPGFLPSAGISLRYRFE